MTEHTNKPIESVYYVPAERCVVCCTDELELRPVKYRDAIGSIMLCEPCAGGSNAETEQNDWIRS